MAGIGESSYRRFLLGQEDAIEDFVRLYSDAMVRFACSIVGAASVAEELAEDAIAVFFFKKKHFPDEQRMRAYLYKMVHSRCMDYLRRHRQEVSLENVEQMPGSGDPETAYLYRERNEILYRSMRRLPLQYREVLWLMYMEEFTVQAICVVMKKNKKQVYNLLARARVALREILDKEGITYEDLQ